MNFDAQDPENDISTNSPQESGDDAESDSAVKKVRLPPKKETKGAFVRSHEPKPTSSSRPTGKVSSQSSAMGPAVDKSLDFAPAGKVEKSDDEAAAMHRRYTDGERRDWGENPARGSSKWMIFTGLGVVFVVILAVTLSQNPEQKTSPKEGDQKPSEVDSTASATSDEVKEFDALSALNFSEKEAKETYGKYASAATAAELDDLIFEIEKVRPLVAKEWKPSGISPGWIPDDRAKWSVHSRNGIIYGILRGAHPDFTDFSAFYRIQGRDLKIDWKATAAYSTATFTELTDGVGNASEIRGRLTPADFYTFSVPEEKFRAYRFTSPDQESNLWVYTLRSSELDEKLLSLFIPSQITGEMQTEPKLTLRLAPGPKDGLPNQWIIQEIISLDWFDHAQK